MGFEIKIQGVRKEGRVESALHDFADYVSPDNFLGDLATLGAEAIAGVIGTTAAVRGLRVKRTARPGQETGPGRPGPGTQRREVMPSTSMVRGLRPGPGGGSKTWDVLEGDRGTSGRPS